MKTPLSLYIMSALAASLLAAACASIGHPEGGPRDNTPPSLVRSTPPGGTLGFKGKKIELVFDENIKLDDPSNKIIISPAQLQMPNISSNGRRLTIELRDTLQPGATYTVDLGDAVRDLNEGNILDGLAIDFSTGQDIDSMRVSGTVLSADNLEPAQGIIVGAYRDAAFADTTLTKVPLERVSRTDQYGRFTIRSLKAEPYRIFAIKDANRDYRWDRSEDVAWLADAAMPSREAIEVVDTLLSSEGTDSLVTRQGVRYLPNDLLLSMFNEHYSPHYIKDYSRPERGKIILKMAAPPQSAPELTIVKGPHAGERLEPYTLVQCSPLGDSLVYWLRDAPLRQADTLMVATRYLKTDSAEQLRWTIDTLKFNFRAPKTKKKKKKDDQEDDEEVVFVTLQPLTPNVQDLDVPLRLKASTPLADIDLRGVRLEIRPDTAWVPMPPLKALKADTLDPLLYTLAPPAGRWDEGATYRLVADSAAVRSIWDEPSNTTKFEFKTRSLADYASLTFRLTGYDSARGAVVQLLSSNDKPQYTATADSAGVAHFAWITPGTYYARAWVDTDGDGQWTTGNIASRRQPEEVSYYPKKLNLRANWDVDQTWDLNDIAVDEQKPNDIKKNRPKLKDGSSQRRDQEEEEDDTNDRFYTPDGQYRGLPQNEYDRQRGRLQRR